MTRYIIVDDFCHSKKKEYIYLFVAYIYAYIDDCCYSKNSIHIVWCVCHSLNSAPPKHQSWIRPCYEGTQQDLTGEKERLQGYADLRRIKGSLKQESRLIFTEKLTND